MYRDSNADSMNSTTARSACQVNVVRQSQRRLEARSEQLESLSPLAVLARGYSVTQRHDNKIIVRDARELKVGDQLITHYAVGGTVSRVEAIDTGETAESGTDGS